MDNLAKTREFLRSPIPSCSGTASAYYFGSFVAQLSINCRATRVHRSQMLTAYRSVR
jgi:hypothetical protein